MLAETGSVGASYSMAWLDFFVSTCATRANGGADSPVLCPETFNDRGRHYDTTTKNVWPGRLANYWSLFGQRIGYAQRSWRCETNANSNLNP